MDVGFDLLIQKVSEYGFMWVFSIFMLYIMNRAVNKYLELTEKGIERLIGQVELVSKNLEQTINPKLENLTKQNQNIEINLQKTSECLAKISEFLYERTPNPK